MSSVKTTKNHLLAEQPRHVRRPDVPAPALARVDALGQPDDQPERDRADEVGEGDQQGQLRGHALLPRRRGTVFQRSGHDALIRRRGSPVSLCYRVDAGDESRFALSRVVDRLAANARRRVDSRRTSNFLSRDRVAGCDSDRPGGIEQSVASRPMMLAHRQRCRAWSIGDRSVATPPMITTARRFSLGRR